jgi:hypothetical protein
LVAASVVVSTLLRVTGVLDRDRAVAELSGRRPVSEPLLGRIVSCCSKVRHVVRGLLGKGRIVMGLGLLENGRIVIGLLEKGRIVTGLLEKGRTVLGLLLRGGRTVSAPLLTRGREVVPTGERSSAVDTWSPRGKLLML